MAKIAFDTIKKTENQAKEIVYKSEEKSKLMLENANKQAEIDIKNTKDECKAIIAREKAVATKKALVQTNQFNEETKKLCEKLESDLLRKRKKAVFELIKFIIEIG